MNLKKLEYLKVAYISILTKRTKAWIPEGRVLKLVELSKRKEVKEVEEEEEEEEEEGGGEEKEGEKSFSFASVPAPGTP